MTTLKEWCLAGAVIVILVLITGCATPERYLSLEEDAKMRTACEQGCITLPGPVWMQIQQILQALGMRGT